MAVGGKLNDRRGDRDDHPGRHRRDQHDAGGRLDHRRAPARRRRRCRARAGSGTSRRRPPTHAGRHDLHAQDLHGRRPGEPSRARSCAINGDDSHVTYVNGQQVAQSGTRQQRLADLADRRHQAAARRRARTSIAVAATNGGSGGGLIAALAARRPADRHRHVVEGARGHAGDAAGGLEHGRVRRLRVARRVLQRRSTASRRGTRTSRTPATPNPSNIKVASVAGFQVGDAITVDTGANPETRTISAVGTAGANGTGITRQPAA